MLNKVIDNLKKLLDKHRLSFFFIAVFMFWFKTYAAYLIEFNLAINNTLQNILLFVNPLSSALLFIGLALFMKGKTQPIVMIIIQFFLSVVLYANVVYYRFFSDFITIPAILQTKTNAGQLGDSAISLMSPFDIFYFSDTTILILLLVYKIYRPKRQVNRRPALCIFIAAILILFINVQIAESDRSDLLTRTFDRTYLVKYLGVYNFTIYDIVQNVGSESQRVLADSNDITKVENYVKANYAAPNPIYFGKAKGKNVIYISLESLQSFIIDYKIQGQEVTPFLNSLVHGGDAFYFENFFHQTGQGKTSDAEFMMENSLYPMSQGAVFVNKAQNTFQSAPAILKTKGYTSAVFHGNYKTFWNRNEMYKSLGYDRFYDAEYYSMSEEYTKNYGMKDKPFFTESMPLLSSLPQPFYSKFILLSNHFPFKMDEGDTDFPAGDFGDDVVNHYFQSAHYMDEALEQFFNDIKASGLYDNTIIVMYGDHYGISENHNNAMAQVLGKDEITDFDYAQLQRVPLFIHVPEVEGKVVSEFGGQVDVMPTVMHLLGVDTKDYLQMGSDLLSDEHRQLIPFRDGDFISPEITKVGDHIYSTNRAELLETEIYNGFIEKSTKELSISDEIVYKDLLRFNHPEGFVPIDRREYQYIKK